MDSVKNKKAITIGLVAVLALILIGLASYAVISNLSKDTDSDTSANETPDPNLDATINEPKTTHSTEMPTDLPGDAPLFKDAELIDASTTTMGPETTEYSLNFHTKSSPAEVFAFYKDALSSNGWKTHVVTSRDTFNAIAASHRDKNLNANFSGPTSLPSGADTNYMISISVMNPIEAPAP